MGCLFEVFVEMFIEGIVYLVMFVYLKVAYVLVPSKEISPKVENKIRNIITTVSVLLALTLFIGVILLLPGDSIFNTIGKYMTFISLSVLGLQVVLSIVIMIVKLLKHHKK